MDENGEHTESVVHELFGGAAPSYLESVEESHPGCLAFKKAVLEIHKAANVTRKAAEALIDHIIHAENELGQKKEFDEVKKTAVKLFGKAKKKNRKEIAPGDAISGGWSFNDFVSGVQKSIFPLPHGGAILDQDQLEHQIGGMILAPSGRRSRKMASSAIPEIEVPTDAPANLQDRPVPDFMESGKKGGASLGGASLGGFIIEVPRKRGRPRKEAQ